jgi:hypothetical protein
MDVCRVRLLAFVHDNLHAQVSAVSGRGALIDTSFRTYAVRRAFSSAYACQVLRTTRGALPRVALPARWQSATACVKAGGSGPALASQGPSPM